MGKWPTKRKTIAVHGKAHSQQTPYFGPELRAFLKDAALLKGFSSTSSLLNGQISVSRSSELKTSPDVMDNLCHRVASTSMSENSLRMPQHLQTQNLREICACLNTSSDGRPLTTWQSAIPFSVDPVMVYKSSAKIRDQSPVRRMIQDFATAFHCRMTDRRVRLQLRTNDADYGYFLLALHKYKKVLEHYSQAYQRSDVAVLPIEIKCIITEMLELLPILPAGRDALALMTVRGSVAIPSTFACCLPRLAGSNQVQGFRELQVSASARQALENFGGRTQLGGLYKRVMLRLRKDYPGFADHDVLHAIGLLTCILTCYEHYHLGLQTHALAQRQSDRESKIQHMSLMRGLSAHAPLSESVTSLPRPITAPETNMACTSALALASPSDEKVTQPSIESPVKPGEASVNTSHSWLAPVLPPFSSKTFAGPFGRSEQQVLNRLLELESSGRLEHGHSTMGRSFYRDAVCTPVKTTPTDAQQVQRGCRPHLVERKSSSEDQFRSCLPSLDHVDGSSSPVRVTPPDDSSSVLEAQPRHPCSGPDLPVLATPGSILGHRLWDLWSPTSCKTDLHIVNGSPPSR